MALPVYKTIVGPVNTNLADGATALNTMANTAEDDYTLLNQWAGDADAAFTASPAVTGTAFCTPAAGWALRPDVGFCYGRRWGAVTFIKLSLRRTGAAFTADRYGNVADMLLGTLAPPFWPPLVSDGMFPVGSMEVLAPCQIGIYGGGAVYLLWQNQPNQVWATDYHAFVQACWINTDAQPI